MFAILTALEPELESFLDKTNNKITHNWNNNKFIIGIFAGQECILGHTGIGKVNSAVVVSYIIGKYNPSYVFYTGIAGALRTNLNIGDVVVARDSIQWDVDISSFGFKIGELPSVNTVAGENKKVNNVRFYKTEQNLFNKTMEWKPLGYKIKQGRIITGDSFFTSSMQIVKADLVEELDGSAVDMEGAAVGAACSLHNVPYFLARVISDTIEGNKPKRFKQFLKDSSHKMAELLEFIFIDFS